MTHNPPLFVNSYVSESLTTSDDYEFRNGEGYYYDDYLLTYLVPGEPVTVTLNSQSFDTWLAIYDYDSGSLLYYNDDGGVGITDSQLTFMPEINAGYVVSVSTFGSNLTGDYTISAYS